MLIKVVRLPKVLGAFRTVIVILVGLDVSTKAVTSQKALGVLRTDDVLIFGMCPQMTLELTRPSTPFATKEPTVDKRFSPHVQPQMNL